MRISKLISNPINYLVLFFFAAASCSSEVGQDAEVNSEHITPQSIESFLKPVAEVMKEDNVQLSSYFDDESFNGGEVTLTCSVRSTGSKGSDPILIMESFSVDGVDFAPFVVVSKEEKEKVQSALKDAEQDGKESIPVTFAGQLVRDGSMKSPFSGELQLKFANGSIVEI